jgi:peptidoglycan/xylan/chitin deacetylase (PgdA/CDA1 family)
VVVVMEQIIARHDRVAVLMDGREQIFNCRSVKEKYNLFETHGRWLWSLPSNEEISRSVHRLAARYGVDMRAVCTRLCMPWSEIAALADDPLVTIGAHSVRHVILAKADEREVRSELAASRSAIEAAVGKRPDYLAYPFGDETAAGAREIRIASELGFKMAFTARRGVVFPRHAEQLAALPRVSLHGDFQRLRYVPVLLSGAPTTLWNVARRVAA